MLLDIGTVVFITFKDYLNYVKTIRFPERCWYRHNLSIPLSPGVSLRFVVFV